MIRRLFVAGLLALCAVWAHADSTLIPFIPRATSNAAVTASAQSLTVPDYYGQESSFRSVVLNCVGTQTVFFTTDGSTATTSNGMPIQPGQAFVISIPNKTTSISVISGTTGSTLYLTVGDGQ
jgi:hypothetical protein